jgi:hypothetical protein
MLSPWRLYIQVPVVQKVGWAPGTVWTGAENLTPTGILSKNRPASSEQLHRVSYPGPPFRANKLQNFHLFLSVPRLRMCLLCTFMTGDTETNVLAQFEKLRVWNVIRDKTCRCDTWDKILWRCGEVQVFQMKLGNKNRLHEKDQCGIYSYSGNVCCRLLSKV